jgi:hypothetical protein
MSERMAAMAARASAVARNRAGDQAARLLRRLESLSDGAAEVRNGPHNSDQ